MNYKNIIELLLLEFPNFKEKLEIENYLSDLPYCVFEMILIPYVKKICEEAEKEELIKLETFLEKMAMCEDMKVQELFHISFLEPIVLDDKQILYILQNYFGEKSLKELDYWKKRYR